MKVKIPREIKIASHTYTLTLDSQLRDDGDRYGEVNHRLQTIKIWADAPLSLKNEALVHELIHIAQMFYRVDITDADIDRVAETVCQFLFNNLGIEFDWSEIKEE